jgi:hypothetical protein
MTRTAFFFWPFTFAAATLALAVTADAYTARNRMIVEDIGKATFEVISRAGRSTAPDYWCAAGDYALSRGFASSARIYLVRAPGPSFTQANRKAVQFTLQPDIVGIAPIPPQLSLSVTSVGDNLSLASAREYCYSDSRKSE